MFVRPPTTDVTVAVARAVADLATCLQRKEHWMIGQARVTELARGRRGCGADIYACLPFREVPRRGRSLLARVGWGGRSELACDAYAEGEMAEERRGRACSEACQRFVGQLMFARWSGRPGFWMVGGWILHALMDPVR